jgi:tetratricopeptide (TPR) repeat protein
MTNENDQDLTRSSQQKLTKYSSDLIKKGLGLAKSIQSPDNTPEDWRLKGNDFFRSGDFEEALVCYEQALKLDPLYSFAWNNRGSVLNSLNRYEEALDSFNKAVETDPKNDLAWRNRGKILSGKFQRYEESIYSHDKVLEINPKDYQSYFLKGAHLVKLGRYEEAEDSYNKSLEIKIDQWDVWLNHGNNLANNLGKYEEALLGYNNVLKFKPILSDNQIEENQGIFQEYIIWMLRGAVLHQLNRYDDALKSYQKALELTPNKQESLLLFECGNQLYCLELYPDALDYFDKALELETGPKAAAEIWYNKAQVFVKIEMYENAVSCYKNALLYDSSHINAWNNKGYILEKLGYYKEAMYSYTQVLKIVPSHKAAHNNIQRLLSILDDIELEVLKALEGL